MGEALAQKILLVAGHFVAKPTREAGEVTTLLLADQPISTPILRQWPNERVMRQCL